MSSNGSGDIFIAFSTANAGAAEARETAQVSMLSNARIGAVFEATVQATEEAIVNALVAGETMSGIDGHRAAGCRTTGFEKFCVSTAASRSDAGRRADRRKPTADRC